MYQLNFNLLFNMFNRIIFYAAQTHTQDHGISQAVMDASMLPSKTINMKAS